MKATTACCGLLFLVVWVSLAVAQFGPGGPSTPNSPSSSRYGPPDLPGASPPRGFSGSGSYPRSNLDPPPPTPYGMRSNDFRGQRGQYIPNQPTTTPPYGNPGLDYVPGSRGFMDEPPGPTGFYNPFFRSEPSTRGFPSQGNLYTHPQTRIATSHLHRPGMRWQQAESLIETGNLNHIQAFVDEQLAADHSLGNLMSAVSTFERMNASRSTFSTYRTEALQLARQQIRDGSDAVLPYVAVAKFSLEDANDDVFRNTAQELRQRFPESEYSYYFNGILALKDQDWKAAEQSLRRAGELGLPEGSIASWLKMAIDNQRWIWQYAWITLWLLVAWLGGLLILYVAGRVLSSVTLRRIEHCDPNDLERRQGWTRCVYRHLINVAGLYYYLSLPAVLVLSIALPLSIGYALLHVPVLNLWLIGLVLLVGLGSILTALSGFLACFVSVDRQIPGRPLSRDQHARLWNVVEEVANHVGTRPVDDIYLTPSAVVAVTEQGGFLKRLRDRGRRVLILGVGVLDGFPQRAFRSVLAHEYGHFLNRDSAGGDVALRVNSAMENFAHVIVQRGLVWHVAVLFLHWYYHLFNRLTFGASRLQEFLADRVAVRAYGSRSMRDGLTHVIRRSLEFERWTSDHLAALVGQQTLGSHFCQSMSAADRDNWLPLEAVIHEVFEQPTTRADTHPSARDRLAFAEQVVESDVDSRRLEGADSDQSLVWELFDRPGATYAELHAEIAKLLAQQAEFYTLLNRERLKIVQQAARGPFDPTKYQAQANLLAALGRHTEAFDVLDVLAKRFPNDLHIKLERVALLKSMDRHNDAISELEETLALPEHKPQTTLRLLLAELYRVAGKLADAEAELSRCLDHEPGFLAARIIRGQVRMQLDCPSDAVSDYSVVVQEMPYASEVFVDRAIAYRAFGKRSEAIQDLQAAIGNDATSSRAHRELGQWLVDSYPHQAMRHAIIACDSMKGWRESLRVLVEVGRGTNQHIEAAAFLDDFIPRLPTEEHETWRKAAWQLREEAVQDKPECLSDSDEPPMRNPQMTVVRAGIDREGMYKCACGQSFPLRTHAGTARTACPVCRQRIETTEADNAVNTST